MPPPEVVLMLASPKSVILTSPLEFTRTIHVFLRLQNVLFENLLFEG